MFEETENCIEKYESIYNTLEITFKIIGVLMLTGTIIAISYLSMYGLSLTGTIITILIIIIGFLLYILSCKIVLALIQWQKLILSNLLYINDTMIEKHMQNKLEHSTN